jgi:hypothetical protein
MIKHNFEKVIDLGVVLISLSLLDTKDSYGQAQEFI